jgi:hypothetical protein
MPSAGPREMEALAATVVDRLAGRLVGQSSGRYRVEAYFK